MTRPVAAQEDRLVLPVEWASRLLPRRGDVPGERAAAGPAATGAVREAIELRRGDLTASLEHPECDPALARAGLAHLGGEPNPAGAAAVVSMLRFAEPYRGAMFTQGGDSAVANRALFSSLVAEHGLAFAISAAVEDLGCDIGWDRTARREPDDLPFLTAENRSSLKWLIWADPAGPLPLARALAAAADADEYERAVALAAGHRDTASKRVAAAILLPDRTDWVADACREREVRLGGLHVEALLWSVVSGPEHLDALGLKKLAVTDVVPGVIAELVANLGVAALPLLAATLRHKSLRPEQRSLLFEAVALLPDDEATALLVEEGGQPQSLPALRAAAARFPDRVVRAVAARADAMGPVDRARFAGVLGHDDVDLETALERLDPDRRRALEALVAEGAPPIAEPERLPALLVAPPWADRRRRRPTEPLRGLEAPQRIEIVWDAAEHERAMAVEPSFASWDESYWHAISGRVVNQIGLGLSDCFWGQLARNGADAADKIVERLREKPKYAQALVPIRSPKAALLAADWFARLKSARSHAADWLDRHGPHAAALLVPIALGGDKRRRVGAEAALLHLGRSLGVGAVLDAAEPYGPEAVSRVKELLAADPLEPLGGTVPKPGAWADPDVLPPVMLKDRRLALPRTAVANLIAALSLWTPRIPYPGVEAVAEACDTDSLRRFSHALFELWLRADAPARDSWAVDQLARFGDDTTVALLDPLIETWPGRSQPDRARYGLDVLAHIGTGAAFAALYRLSRIGKFATVAEHARRLADAIAASRGRTAEQLADDLVPDHGLAGPVEIDYGPRRFGVRFDDLLNPAIVDDTGRERRRLPKPGVRDDAALAKTEAARFKRLTKDLERTAAEQAGRLEEAMLDSRTWTFAEFRSLTGNPVIASLAKRLVWLSGETGFRLAEDGGLADVRDRDFAPDTAAPIRLAHPALLGDDLPAWITLFGDYTLLQPFEQLTRPALAFTDAERATGRLERFEGAEAAMGELRAILDWQGRYPAPDELSTRVWDLSRRVPGGVLTVDIHPAPSSHDPDPREYHTLTSVRLMTTRNRHPAAAKPLPGERLDPVTAAELLGGLTAATRTRTN